MSIFKNTMIDFFISNLDVHCWMKPSPYTNEELLDNIRVYITQNETFICLVKTDKG